MIRLFLSHSSEDSEIAASLVQLFSTAIGLRSQEIRCTSIDGYRLPGGADFDEQLRDEILSAECFVGLVSEKSLSSAYVLFELGARWGAKKQLIPLLAPGASAESLKGPLKGLNALSCTKMAELQQLAHEISQTLSAQLEPPAVYQRHIEAITSYAIGRGTSLATAEKPPPSVLPLSGSYGLDSDFADDYSDSDAVISRHCQSEWQDDYAMRAYCIKQQVEAVSKLSRGRPADIPEDVFRLVRRKCATEWPDDYSMRVYTEEQQFLAYRKLQSTNRR